MSQPSKHDALLTLLQGRHSVFVHLDPRHPGVVVPPHLSRQPQVVFQLGYNLPQPIRDLTISEKGWSAGLAFKGQVQFVNVPWTAVFALIGDDKRGRVWDKDMPPEITAKLEEKAPPAAPAVPAMLYDGKETFERARDAAAMERRFDGEKPADAPLAPVISLASRKPRAKA